MIRVYKSFVLLSLSLIFIACPENREKDDSSAKTAEGTEQELPMGESFENIPGIITIQNLWMRTEPEGKGVRQLDIAERVTVIGPEIKLDDGTDLRPIRLEDGQEGYVNKWFIIPNSQPAVLLGEAKIYSEARLTRLTDSDPLTSMLIVAMIPENSKDGFVQVSYSKDGYAYMDQFIKDENISTNEADIAAARLYQVAMKQENTEMRKEFLNSASEMNSPAFARVIADALLETNALPDEDAMEDMTASEN